MIPSIPYIFGKHLALPPLTLLLLVPVTGTEAHEVGEPTERKNIKMEEMLVFECYSMHIKGLGYSVEYE